MKTFFTQLSLSSRAAWTLQSYIFDKADLGT